VLEERGRGFAVAASHGAALIRARRARSSARWRLADERMYTCKRASHARAGTRRGPVDSRSSVFAAESQLA